jgi:hypothetical protein
LNPNECRELEDRNPYEGGDEYENPAITPGAPGSDPADPPAEQQPDDAAGQATAALITSRLQELANVECKRIRTAAATRKNFVGWLDQFYAADGWQKTLARTLESIGGDPTLADAWCGDARAALLDAAGNATADTLPTAVNALLDTWPDRLRLLVDRVTDTLLVPTK